MSRLERAVGSPEMAFEPPMVFYRIKSRIGTGMSSTQTQRLSGSARQEWEETVWRHTQLNYTSTGEGIRFYENYREILDSARKINPDGKETPVKMSIEMCEIFRDGQGRVNEDAIQKYREILTYCKKIGVKPDIVDHHFDDPKWWKIFDGWYNRKMAIFIFTEYVRTVLERFHDLLPKDTHFITINEPNTYAVKEAADEFPPNRRRDRGRLVPFDASIHHKIRLLWEKLRKKQRIHPPNRLVGTRSFFKRVRDVFVLEDNLIAASHAAEAVIDEFSNTHDLEYTAGPSRQMAKVRVIPANGLRGWLNKKTTRLADKLQNDPKLFEGGQGPLLIQYYTAGDVEARWPVFQRDITDQASRTTGDFQVLHIKVHARRSELQAKTGWSYAPVALLAVLDGLAARFPGRYIILSEVGHPGALNAKTKAEDNRARVIHMIDTMMTIHHAEKLGIPIEQVNWWSDSDNSEFGNPDADFGLTEVDFDDHLKRTPRPTYELIQMIARDGGVDFDHVYSWLEQKVGEGVFSPEDVRYIRSHIDQWLAPVSRNEILNLFEGNRRQKLAQKI